MIGLAFFGRDKKPRFILLLELQCQKLQVLVFGHFDFSLLLRGPDETVSVPGPGVRNVFRESFLGLSCFEEKELLLLGQVLIDVDFLLPPTTSRQPVWIVSFERLLQLARGPLHDDLWARSSCVCFNVFVQGSEGAGNVPLVHLHSFVAGNFFDDFAQVLSGLIWHPCDHHLSFWVANWFRFDCFGCSWFSGFSFGKFSFLEIFAFF